MNENARNAYLHHVEGQDARNHERDKVVVKEAMRVKALKPGLTELDLAQNQYSELCSDEITSRTDLFRPKAGLKRQ